MANMVNASFREGVFPATLKHVIVRPRLKKPTLNPDDMELLSTDLQFKFRVEDRGVSSSRQIHRAQ
jgi:hypothetical protein